MKYVKIAIVFLFAVLASGCVQEEKQKTFVSSDSALDISFLEGQPPNRVFGSNNFDVVVLLTNKGGKEVAKNSATLVLNDVSLAHFNAPLTKEFAMKTNNEALDAIKRAPSGELICGSRETLEWNDVAYRSVRPITEEVKTPVSVDACYPYETTAVVKLCIKATNQAPCKDDEEKIVENSGAPIKISEFKELKSENNNGLVEVGFKFKVKKTGDRKYKIYSPRASCFDTAPEVLNFVTVSEMRFLGRVILEGEIPKFCNSVSDAVLEGDNLESEDIFCKISVNTQSSIEDALIIKMSYLAKQSLSKSVQVIPL